MPSVAPAHMRRIYDEVKTPFKYGIVLRGAENESVDCPSIFRDGEKWYMVYVSIKDKVGYQTCLAESDDLLEWKKLGPILPFSGSGWDQWQAAGTIALADFDWNGSGKLQKYREKYWLSFFGGNKQGYEPDPLAIGLACTNDPRRAGPWHRLSENPVLSPTQSDARPFEAATLYRSSILWDKTESLGHPFVMFYNGKQQGRGIERIGMAVSNDLVRWSRFSDDPIIDNRSGISGDPQIVRIGDLWVMFYFGAFWKPGAFDTFACSRDLVHWTKWDGPDLISSSEPWDKTFAHKPWVLKHRGVVYHFYCAVGSEGRVIALATSKDIRARANRADSASANKQKRLSNQPMYLFTSFRNNGEDGLRFLYSNDGYRWQNVPGTFLTPQVGPSRLMRDPSLIRGPDGIFHLVWTTGWSKDQGFGYAHSKDLVNWSEQRFIPVMQHEPTTVNVWAPELYFDEARDQFIICWASTIPGRFPDRLEPHENNQRMYYTTTRDFKTFAPTKLFYDPDFSVIDCAILKHDDAYVLVLKDNTRPQRNLRVAFSDDPLGPWSEISPAITPNFTEGPTALKLADEWIIYFDAYRAQYYGALKTRDFKSFTDISNEVSFPSGHKHGTVVRATTDEVDFLLNAASKLEQDQAEKSR